MIFQLLDLGILFPKLEDYAEVRESYGDVGGRIREFRGLPVNVDSLRTHGFTRLEARLSDLKKTSYLELVRGNKFTKKEGRAIKAKRIAERQA